MTKILIVEDHALLRDAVAHTLARLEPGIECLGAQNADEALGILEMGADWDLVVVDLMLPDMNGFSLLGVLSKRYPALPALVVSALDDAASVRRAMKAGASGFLSKSRSSDELCEAVRIVLDGGVCLPEAGSISPARRAGASAGDRFGLTAGQSRVLELLGQGKTNREIAKLLTLSEGTVKVHVTAILRALKVTNRAQALLVIARYGRRI